MKRETAIILNLAMIFVSGVVFAESGEKLFRDLDCANCHDKTKDRTAQGLGPSLKQISMVYAGKQKELTDFLKGNNLPKIYRRNYIIMKKQTVGISTLKNREVNALAGYLLSLEQPTKSKGEEPEGSP